MIETNDVWHRNYHVLPWYYKHTTSTSLPDWHESLWEIRIRTNDAVRTKLNSASNRDCQHSSTVSPLRRYYQVPDTSNYQSSQVSTVNCSGDFGDWQVTLLLSVLQRSAINKATAAQYYSTRWNWRQSPVWVWKKWVPRHHVTHPSCPWFSHLFSVPSVVSRNHRHRLCGR